MRKVALITGCSSGIGFQTALSLGRNNYTVFASLRDPQSTGAQSLVAIAKKENLDLDVMAIDVTDEASVARGVRTVEEKAGRIDVLVNNAGFLHLGPIEMCSISEMKELFETNFFGTVRMIHAVAPLMRKQKSGLIVNISSINGMVSAPLYGAYSSTKFALETLSEVLRFELSHFGIHVSLVEPGVFDTNVWSNKKRTDHKEGSETVYEKLVVFLDKVAERRRLMQNPILQKFTHPQRVAQVVLRIAGEKSPALRHIVGYDARLLYTLRRLLPEWLWFFILHKVYQW